MVRTRGTTWWRPAARATSGNAIATSMRPPWSCVGDRAQPRDLSWVTVAVGRVPEHWQPYLTPTTLSACVLGRSPTSRRPPSMDASPSDRFPARCGWPSRPRPPSCSGARTPGRRRSGGEDRRRSTPERRGSGPRGPRRPALVRRAPARRGRSLDADVRRSFLWLGDAWVAALAELGVPARRHEGAMVAGRSSKLVCFAGLGPGEVTTLEGAKLVGISQRRTRAGHGFNARCPLFRGTLPASSDSSTCRGRTERKRPPICWGRSATCPSTTTSCSEPSSTSSTDNHASRRRRSASSRPVGYGKGLRLHREG